MIKDLPVLELANDENIISLYADADTNCVLAGTNLGKIIRISQINNNIYGTGYRQFGVMAEDGYGNLSNLYVGDFTYAFYDQILEINEEKNITSFTKDVSIYCALQKEDVTGVFISPILWAGNDIGYWENIQISQTCPTDCQSEFFLRTANSEAEISSASWISFYNGKDDANVNINLSGQYIQLKIEINTDVQSQSPIIHSVNIFYRTKHAVYFFTNKFILEKDSNAKQGFFVAKYSYQPATEIIFGLCDKNSADWNDYQVFKEGKLFDLPASLADKFKIGVKLISHSLNRAIILDEFAFYFGSDKLNQLNK